MINFSLDWLQKDTTAIRKKILCQVKVEQHLLYHFMFSPRLEVPSPWCTILQSRVLCYAFHSLFNHKMLDYKNQHMCTFCKVS